MTNYEQKLENFMFCDIKGKKNLTILEFGVRDGISTKVFVKQCEENGGKVYSIDVNDCSGILNSNHWKFIHSRDDNFEYLEKKLPEKFDIIFLDSFHNANHVEKIFYHYFKKLKNGCYFYFDDISWIPYVKNNFRDNFNCEINNQETFFRLLQILNNNTDIIDLYFSFVSSGMAKILKKNDKQLLMPKKINTRENSIKNILRKIIT